MEIRQFDIWLADLNPQRGTEPGKTRPVVVIQTNLLNEIHPSTVVCPVTTNVKPEIQLLRVHLGDDQLEKPSDVLVDQMRAIDNRRLIRRLAQLSAGEITQLKNNIRVVLDL